MILPFNLDGLQWHSQRASRDVLLQLGYMEDIVDLLEPTLEVNSICYPFYAFHYPEWSHIPRSKLLSTCKMEGLQGQKHFFSYQMLLQPVMLVKIALLVVLWSLQVVLFVLNYLLDMLSEVSCIRHLTLGTYNDINRRLNLFPIYHFKWRVASALRHS